MANELSLSVCLKFYLMFRGHTGTVWFDDAAVAEQIDILCQCNRFDNHRYSPTHGKVRLQFRVCLID